jgi:CHAT domain-containing protein
MARRLVLSPHRALHVLPFHAATIDGRLLIEQAAIRCVPNLGSLIVPWRGASSSRDAGALSIGVDSFKVPGEDWPALNDAEAEAEAVARVWSARGVPTKLMTGPAASVAAFLGLRETLANYRCLHLATHGGSVFEREAANDPFATRIILQDGALDALTISQLRIGAEIVVLSACHSGQQALSGRGLDELPGDDVFGLPAALFEAGVRGVIGALWPVADAVAPILMNTLHDGLAEGAPPELALQKAYLDYLRRPDASRNIFDWAPMFHTSVGRIERARPDGA